MTFSVTEAVHVPTTRPELRTGTGVFVVVLTLHLAIALAVGVESWDDGYITLSFARTFAETGHIGLTPVSEQVEGATSPLWFLLMAAVYGAGVQSFAVFHFASQAAAALCSAAAAVLFYRLISPAVPRAASWITVLVFLLGPVRAETGNGMEMSLLCLVVLAIMVLLRNDDGRNWQWLALLAALVPWIRLEATGYVSAGVIAVWLLASPRHRRPLVGMLAAAVASVAVLTVLRHFVFGTVFFTNTMVAKQMSPYSPPFLSPAWWGQQLIGVVVEPIVTALPAIVIFLILLRISGFRLRDKFATLKRRALARDVPIPIAFGLVYVTAFVGFTVVFGANMYTLPGRMGMSAMLVLVVAAVHAAPVPDEAYRPLPTGAKLAIAGMLLVPCVGLIAYDTLGMSMRVAHRISAGPASRVVAFSAFHANGQAAERVRVMLGLPEISLLLADVGQPALCCQKLRILDLALLVNSELTKTGWDGFPAYLRSQQPDLIQLHASFTEESGITRDEFFTTSYVPIFVDDSSFYLRKDLYGQLKSRCTFVPAPTYYFFMGGEPLTSQKNAPMDSALHIDEDYLKSLGLTDYCRLA